MRTIVLASLVWALGMTPSVSDETAGRPEMTALASPQAAAPPEPDGNPLWSIPLADLTATRDRPLFSPSRRPPPQPTAFTPPPPPPEPVAAPAPPPAPPPFRLIGTIVGPRLRVAMVLDRATNQIARLRQGEVSSGWLAVQVGARNIVVQRGDQTVVLDLPKPGDAPPGGLASAIGANDDTGLPAPPPPPQAAAMETAPTLLPAAASLARLRRQKH